MKIHLLTTLLLSTLFNNLVKNVDILVELLMKNGYSKSFLVIMVKETVDKFIKNPKDPCLRKFGCDLVEMCESDELKSGCDFVEVCESDELNKLNSVSKDDEPKFVLVLPYSEGFKDYKVKIRKQLGNLNYRIVSTSWKVRNMFINKSKTPVELCSDLVYQFTCNGCNATYIGETSRHLCIRAREHCRPKALTHIGEHNKGCKIKIGMSDFKILLKNFDNYSERVICEALLIKSLNPKINVQNTENTCV